MLETKPEELPCHQRKQWTCEGRTSKGLGTWVRALSEQGKESGRGVQEPPRRQWPLLLWKKSLVGTLLEAGTSQGWKQAVGAAVKEKPGQSDGLSCHSQPGHCERQKGHYEEHRADAQESGSRS